MDSSFAELTHAVPDHGSFFSGAGVADITGIKSTVATGAGSGLISAPNGAGSSSGGGGINDCLDADSGVAATKTATIGTGTGTGAGTGTGTTMATTAAAAAAAAAAARAAAPTSQPKSGILSSAQFSAHTQVHTQVHAPAPSAPAPTAPAAAPSSQAPQAFSSFPSSSSPSTPDLNYHSPPPLPSASPPSTHNVLHAHRQNHNSSKLPAYRFADLNKESIALPSLLQHQRQEHRIPPSPVSPDSDQRPETHPNTVNQFSPPKVPGTTTTQKRKTTHDAVSPVPPSEQFDPIRSRASTFQPKSVSLPATTSSTHVKRSTLLDNASAVPNTAGVRSPSGSSETVITVLKRRAPTSPITPSAQDTDAASGGSPAEATKRESLPGQRELLLPKALKRTASDDRRVSISRKPPVSYKPRTNTSVSGVTASIPPIRSFRSSGERRSLVLDMNVRSSRNYDGGDDLGDSNHRDRTLRALEGRRGDEVMQWTPPDSAGERPDGDDSGDLFLKIAREDTVQRPADTSRTCHADKTYHTDNPNAISRVARSARRPLSVAISSYRSPSPPRISRRLSEQESRVRGLGHDQGERTGPPVSYRGHSREPHSEDLKLRGASTSIRGSPLTPRTLTYQDPSESTSAHRRRQPSIDRGSAALPRMTSLKQVNVNYSHPRAYNSSPLVSHADPPKHEAQSNEPVSIEGTDSTTSTAAPSTVWDELEELKSRIHRLELTGKLPPTSSAAISRASDDRPPTAHTNATTLSASPKRGASSAVQSTESPSVPKDSHPLLNSALAKSKDFLAPEVYDALETATIDALSLAAMMGTAGQPGPISSGSSNIGSNSGTVTDRQLRKKADSICRSLTELCLALSENAGAAKPQQITAPPSEDATVTLASPTITQFSGMATQRRPSAPANRALELATSPRTLSRYEDKRASILATSALPSPRYNASIPTTPDAPTAAAAGRKSSLLFSRARRAGTEESEDGRKTSTLVRSRRAGTEEPEDPLDRKPILSRGRRATLDNGEDESRFRTPSRAITEVNGLRPREYISQLHPPPITKEAETLANSALPRRRLGSTTISTRLAQATAVTTPPSAIVTPNRRYVDRSTPGRETVIEGDKTVEDRPQRQFSLARSGSLNRRVTNRQSMIATPSTTTTNYYR
ncbi:hypothetical protein GGR58DRAFT_303118 [Xylaria digitata]|nr:hypothetical protein GGR58DRAFT_303118 [Xylaria digitata]